MSTKVELTAQLALAESRNAALEVTLDEWRTKLVAAETKLAAAEVTRDTWYKSVTTLQAQLEELHCVFDAMGIPRKKKPPENSYEVELSLQARWIYYFHAKEQGMLGSLLHGPRTDNHY